MKKVFFLSFLVIASTLLMANISTAETNGGYAGAFLRMGLGAEALAQGDAFTARANNGFAAYYNPGGLPLLEKRTLAVSYSNLSLDRSFNFIGMSFPLKPTAGVALGWINAGTANIDGRDFDGNHYGDLSYYDNAFTFAFANRFSRYVSAGIGVKILYAMYPEMLEDNKALKSTSVGFDFGILVRPVNSLRIGLQFRDINAKNNWDSSEYWSEGLSKTDKYPSILKFGLAYTPIPELTAEYDMETSSQEAVEHHIGCEYSIFNSENRNFTLRAGYDQDSPAFGFGYLFPLKNLQTKIDAAYIIEDVSPEDTMIFSWTLLY